MKMPRKLKKGRDNLFWTRHMIENRIQLIKNRDEYLEKQYSDRPSILSSLQEGIDEEIDFLKQKLKHPYPVTKWTRKAERMLFKKGEKK